MTKLQGNKKFEILCCLTSVNRLLNTKILWTKDRDLFQYASFTEVLINLNFALQFAKIVLKKEIDFADDIRTHGEIKNITSLIRFFRNAACHIASPNRYFGDPNHPSGLKSMFSHINGKGVDDIDPLCESKYEDDVAYFVGTEVLYLKRHIERAFNEAIQVYKDFLSAHVMRSFNLIN